jgi:flagellar hook-associated protein 2
VAVADGDRPRAFSGLKIFRPIADTFPEEYPALGLTPLSFTGVSSFSESFTQILERSQRVAALPLESLQNQKTDLVQQKGLAASLQGVLTALESSFRNLRTVGDRAGVIGQSSNTAKVQVAAVTATSPASYTISEITSVAAAASETSLTGYGSSTAVSATGTVRLTFGSNTYDITLTPAENNLTGLRDKINALGIGVTASIFTTGTGPTPNYLSLTSVTTGATTLTLEDDPTGANTPLVTANNQGSNAVFKLNGVPVSKTSNTVNDVIPGIAFTIAGTTSGSETVQLNLSSDRSQLSTALQSFVAAYNNVVDFLDTQIGETAGLLSGSNLIFSTASALRSLTGFSGGRSLKSLSDLGVSLDSSGRMSFDAATFGTISGSQLADAFALAGSSPDGIGSLLPTITNLSDSINGAITVELNQFSRTETRLNDQIAELTTRLNAQQADLRLRLQTADAALAQLESQRSALTSQLDSLNLTLYGRRNDR